LVVTDNLQCQYVVGVAEAIRRAKARVLYLPAYSSDLNPIEQAFARLKAELRPSAAGMLLKCW
jgi:transposase